MKKYIFHTQDLCLRTNLICAKDSARMEIFMKELLYGIVELLAKIHSYLLRLNDAYEYNFSDKELHFLVIGILGMMLEY